MNYTTWQEALEAVEWDQQIDVLSVYRACEQLTDGRHKRGVCYIGADLSTGCSPDCRLSTSRLQPGALLALAVPPLAPVSAHIAS